MHWSGPILIPVRVDDEQVLLSIARTVVTLASLHADKGVMISQPT